MQVSRKREQRVELIYENGIFKERIIKNVTGKEQLDNKNLKKFVKIVENYREDIVRKWIDFFVYNVEITPIKINKMIVSINKAYYLGNYQIKILFSDNKVEIIDFRQFLQNAKNPMTKKYLDEKLFASFEIKYGDLVWNDFDLAFPIWDLYTNKIN